MNDIPAFNPAERRAVEAAMIYRYGQLVDLQEADVEVRLTPGSDALTTVPGIYWNERNVQFVVCKLPEQRYRSYFFYTEDQQYRIGEQDYDVIEDCVRNLLQLQVDHDAKRRAIMSNPGLGLDEDYHGPIVSNPSDEDLHRLRQPRPRPDAGRRRRGSQIPRRRGRPALR
jgi:hypothetical protein